MLFYFDFKYVYISDTLKLVWETIPQLLASEGKRALTYRVVYVGGPYS